MFLGSRLDGRQDGEWGRSSPALPISAAVGDTDGCCPEPSQANLGFRASGGRLKGHSSDPRATLVTTEPPSDPRAGSGPGHPTLAEAPAGLCHQKFILLQARGCTLLEDSIYPAGGLILSYSQRTSEKSPVLVILYMMKRKGKAELRPQAVAEAKGQRSLSSLARYYPDGKELFLGQTKCFPTPGSCNKVVNLFL